jgi:rare lipoprotein A
MEAVQDRGGGIAGMMRILIRQNVLLATAASLFLLGACAKKHKSASVPNAPQPSRAAARAPAKPLPVGYTETGVASWYGIPYHGRPAADGEIYDMEKLVAAHRLMPFNTWVRVTNLVNNKAVDVRIIDRGPFVDGRIIDLSKAAARSIDLLGPGIGQVRLEVIAAPQDIVSNDFYAVQVGAFSIYGNADRLRQQYAERFGTAQLVVKEGTTPLWRVLVGKVNSIDAAQALANQLRTEGGEVFVVRLDSTLPTAAPAGSTQLPFAAVPR